VLDLNDIVAETQTMPARVIGENIESSTTRAEDLGSISADQGQIEQIDERSLIGSETVLLVEDEKALRTVGRKMLEMYGYTVLLAADGAAGLELAQNHPDPIQLLMTDIVMPKMGGIELAEQLSTLRPGLKVLYTSGYNDSGGNPQRVAGARYLQKPYAMKDLARTLRELLDSAHPTVSGPPPEHA